MIATSHLSMKDVAVAVEQCLEVKEIVDLEKRDNEMDKMEGGG